jgi:hypothetical protein
VYVAADGGSFSRTVGVKIGYMEQTGGEMGQR